MLYLELKKIFKRITLLGILGFIIVTALLTMTLTYIFFNKLPPEQNNTAAYHNLVTKINTWTDAEANQRETALLALNDFHQKYKILNASTYQGDMQTAFLNAKTAFSYIDFSMLNTDYWLVRENDIVTLMEEKNKMTDFYNKTTITREDFAAMSQMWETQHLTAILDNISVQKLTPNELADLKNIADTYNKDTAPAYINCVYNVINNTYKIYIANNFNGSLHKYIGFEDYDKPTAERAIALNKSLLDNNQYSNNSKAFTFGNIYNSGGDKISVWDYVFTNLEMAGIPLIIITIVFMTAGFFTDIYTNTIVGVVSGRRSRISIVLHKLIAVVIATSAVLLVMTVIYILAAVLLFDAAFAAAPIVFLANGAVPVTMSGANYFVLYFFSLLFKLLFFMLTAGLFSLSRSNPKIIVGLSCGFIAAMLLSNALLGGLWFYQFIPLLALHPINYFGAVLFASPMPSTYNILYTIPVLTAYLIIGYWQLIHNFSKRDFAI
jgi:hypothetical protein